MTTDDGFDDIETTHRPRTARAEAGVDAYEIEVTAGPDRGARLRLDPAEPLRILVGQSPACALRLSDREVSRRHIALECQPNGVRLTDLGSTNGTAVDGLTVYEACLRGGEAIVIGTTTLTTRRIDATGSRPVISAVDRFGRVLGQSVEMRRLYPLCVRVAASRVPVVLEGETGTGKEVLAESIHEASPLSSGPFVVFDCTTVAPSLIESALFGHERGAFTGATQTQIGVFEEADGGTLLIDEVGDLDIALQAKLLRALERGEIRRVGGRTWIKVQVRVLAATRRDLDQEVQAGRFRDDLYFRIAVARVELPPLRRRASDIPVLVRHFWKELEGPGVPPAALIERFLKHTWPGNVRELANAVARQIALGDLSPGPDSAQTGEPARRTGLANEVLRPAAVDLASDHAPPRDVLSSVLDRDLPLARAREIVVDEFERRYVERVLARNNGSVTQAAAASGLARRYFQILRAKKRPRPT
jgi:two-component system, NtrC family, response regulator HydG